jgi:hypothetical protein
VDKVAKTCRVCNDEYYAKRATSRFCSTRCRVKYNRDNTEEMKDPVISKEPKVLNEPAQERKIPTTQEEIEAYYTLANFPPVKYHSATGGGSGSHSPYPMNDPRSKAYSLR